MTFEYCVKNIGRTKNHKGMTKKLNALGNEEWELINFKVNNDKTLTGIFKKST